MAGVITNIEDLLLKLPIGVSLGCSAQDLHDLIVSLATGQTGYADYPDTATAGTPITLPAGVWTDLTNDKLGSTAREDLPVGVTSLFNSSTNKIDLSELPLDSVIEYRVDVDVITATANTDIDMRISLAEGHAGAFQVSLIPTTPYKTAGTHNLLSDDTFYVGPNVSANPGSIQIRAEKAATCVVNGWVQFINLRGKA